MLDVTDTTFETAVIERSKQVPVVVDLWAPWCGPCKTLGPILEKVVNERAPKVEGVKVNVDENPAVASAFQVQSIPAVYGVAGGKVVDGFLGAQPEQAVAAFVDRLLPTEEESEIDKLVAAGDEASLRQALELDADHEEAVLALADILVTDGRSDEALALLARLPESPQTRHLAARARQGDDSSDPEQRLGELIGQVKTDESARQEFLDLLELLGPDDPRTASWRKQLTTALY